MNVRFFGYVLFLFCFRFLLVNSVRSISYDKGAEKECVFLLTSLGDLQSYLSDLSIFMGNTSKKICSLVHNRPWLNPGTRSVHFWQLVVTKFVKTASKYGFIMFEIQWANVRDISYLNELLTDISLAIEAKLMRRWEFESFDQAVTNMSQWFLGSIPEKSCLIEYLHTTKGEVFLDPETDFSKTSPVDDEDNHVSVEHESLCCSRSVLSVDHSTADYNENEIHKPPLTGPYKRRRVTRAMSCFPRELATGNGKDMPHSELYSQSAIYTVSVTEEIFSLLIHSVEDIAHNRLSRENIKSLKTVKNGSRYGQNSLATAMTQVKLAFPYYVPLCGAGILGSHLEFLASALDGRISVGCETALTMAQAVQSFVSLLVRSLVNPPFEVSALFLPLWNSLAETVESLVSVVWIVIESGFSLVGDVVGLVLMPIWLIVTSTVLLPLILWEVLYTPIGVVAALASGLAFSFSTIFDVLGDLWRYMSSKLTSDSTIYTGSVTDEIVSLLRHSVEDIALNRLSRENLKRPKTVKKGSRYGQSSLATAVTQVKLCCMWSRNFGKPVPRQCFGCENISEMRDSNLAGLYHYLGELFATLGDRDRYRSVEESEQLTETVGER